MADPGDNLSHAIINDDDLLIILQRNPVVANTEVCIKSWDSIHDCLTKEYSAIRGMTVRLNIFLGKGPIRSIFFKKEKEQLIIDETIVKGKDVVLPFIWANKKNLKMYGDLAKKCIDNGANTVVGIFASRLVPTMDGREVVTIPAKYEPSSFCSSLLFNF